MRVTVRGRVSVYVARTVTIDDDLYKTIIDPKVTSKEDFDATAGQLLDGDLAPIMRLEGAEFECDEMEEVK